VILVGDTGVGKTYILSRYIKNARPKNQFPTIGVEFATKAVPLKAGGTVKAQIWDTAGQERFRAITSAHYRKSIGALIVYDITNLASYESVQKWIEEVREHAEPEIVIMLVGNKLDLCEARPGDRKVPCKDAAQFAQENNLLFMETSAVQDVNVRDCFETLVQEIYIVQNSQDLNNRRNQQKRGRVLEVNDWSEGGGEAS
jgi:small GTP-binding protein